MELRPPNHGTANQRPGMVAWGVGTVVNVYNNNNNYEGSVRAEYPICGLVYRVVTPLPRANAMLAKSVSVSLAYLVWR